MKKYWLTIIFALTAVAVIAIATVVVNVVVGNLAENNLIRIAEENTARDGAHIQSMMRMMGPTGAMADMGDMSPAGGAGMKQDSDSTMGSAAMQGIEQSMALTLESLAAPDGLPSMYASLVEGLNIVKFNLLDLDGTAVWSTDPSTIGVSEVENLAYKKATSGETSSQLVNDLDLVDFDGLSRRVDVVETLLPLRETPSGPIIGAMGIYRDVAGDVAIQVYDAKRAVLWTTVGTMGGLFIVLFGFIIVANVAMNRANRREVMVVEEARQTLEDRVRERTKELVDAQEQLVRTEKLAAIGQLAGQVAHGIRNPLGAISNAVFYLKRKAGRKRTGRG